MNEVEKKVVKINQDPAYDQFITLVKTRQDKCFPKILSHDRPKGDFVSGNNVAYSVTEMEQLYPLSPTEQQSLQAWLSEACLLLGDRKAIGASLDDPFEIKGGLCALYEYVVANKINLDVLKISNFMARVDGNVREIVITDPFN